MSVATSTAIGLAVAAGTAGAGAIAAHESASAARDAAATQSKAATTAAGTQSAAATKTAQIQADAANRAADLQAKAAADALAFSRAQSQTSLDQYNQQQQRLTPYRNLGNFALGQPMEGPPAPLQLPNLPSSSTNSAQSLVSAPPPAGMDQLSDPSKWMALVSDTPALTSWVQQGLGPAAAKPGLVDYYVGKIKGQPGANPQEQAGSANYWLQKLRSDPELAGAQATGGTAARTGPVTLSYTPQPAYAAPTAPLTPALQPPPMQYPYAPLNAIGKQV